MRYEIGAENNSLDKGRKVVHKFQNCREAKIACFKQTRGRPSDCGHSHPSVIQLVS